ncbi:hypothetical protein [Clostridium tetani]|uniref:hypothetical protein n=1 Tax=Clostridium tetani TaxID=1513 RepID=UPI0037BF21BE
MCGKCSLNCPVQSITTDNEGYPIIEVSTCIHSIGAFTIAHAKYYHCQEKLLQKRYTTNMKFLSKQHKISCKKILNLIFLT